MANCIGCGGGLGVGLLACPSCGQLVHAEQLKALAARADAREKAGDKEAALSAWRAALDLLPSNTRQRAQIESKVLALSRAIDAPTEPQSSKTQKSALQKGWAGIVAVIVFILTKAKLLLLGLTKAGTLFSMLASLGVYWAAFGWKFALGLIVSLYIHEMGHVAWLRRYGIAASAPMFVPGFGAFVRMKQYPMEPREDARIGLAGPMWGLATAAAFLAVGMWREWPSWLAIAHIGAWINLFNLIPVWQLDGARAFRALSRSQRWITVAAVGLAYAINGDGIFILLLICVAWRALSKDAPIERDRGVLLEYAGLVLMLALIARR